MYGLIFDVDGVIADTEAANSAATAAVLKTMFGISCVQRSDFEAGLGRGAEEYVRAGARAHGVDIPDSEISAAVAARQEGFLELLKRDPMPPFPGVLELMNAAIESDEFRAAIATSGTREKSEAVLRSVGAPYDRIVYITGSDVANKKPAPDLYLRAVEELGIPASSCAVIEDSPDGITAAHAAGCACLAVTNSAPASKLARADMIVNNLEQMTINSIRKLIEDTQCTNKSLPAS